MKRHKKKCQIRNQRPKFHPKKRYAISNSKMVKLCNIPSFMHNS